MEPIKKRNNEGKGLYLAAALFIAVGLLLLGKNLGIIEIELYRTLVSWRMLLVVLGLFFLVRRQPLPGIILLAIGAYGMIKHIPFLHINLDVFFWPAVLIAVGIYFLVKRKSPDCHHKNPHVEHTQYSSEEGFLRSESSFGAIHQIVTDEVFKGGVIRNSFGSTTIDLRRTTLPEGQTILDVSSNFGGIELYIPSNWNVLNETNVFLGGVEDNRLAGLSVDTSRVLILRGNISFGGLEIKG